MPNVTLHVDFPTLVVLDRADPTAMLTPDEIATATAMAWRQLHELSEVASIVADYQRPNLKHQYGAVAVSEGSR